jgi:hypothetical protein
MDVYYKKMSFSITIDIIWDGRRDINPSSSALKFEKNSKETLIL